MRFRLLALSVVAATACRPVRPQQSLVKVVGGTEVHDEDPVMRSTIAIMRDGSQYCTGTLLGPNQIVSAAHCLKDFRGISLGTGTTPRAIPGLTVKSGRVHPQFVEEATDKRSPRFGLPGGAVGPYDIAVITFEGTLPPNLVPVQVASLSVTGQPKLVIAGYGATGDDKQGGGTLRRATIQVRNFLDKAREFDSVLGLGTNSCYGDSGGPAYYEEAPGRFTLMGAVSRGYECNTGDGVYTDVRMYQGWMKCMFAALGHPLTSLRDDASTSECKPNGPAVAVAKGTTATETGTDTSTSSSTSFSPSYYGPVPSATAE